MVNIYLPIYPTNINSKEKRIVIIKLQKETVQLFMFIPSPSISFSILPILRNRGITCPSSQTQYHLICKYIKSSLASVEKAREDLTTKSIQKIETKRNKQGKQLNYRDLHNAKIKKKWTETITGKSTMVQSSKEISVIHISCVSFQFSFVEPQNF